MQMLDGGYVLAGGRSSRMGRNKAHLPWNGTSLVEYICSEVHHVTGTVATVGGEPVRGIRCVPDACPDFGPVSGIAAALADTAAEWNVIVACDMPFLDRNVLHLMLTQARGSAVIAETPDGRIHPLCGVWNRRALGAIQQALRDGVHRLLDVAHSVEAETVPIGSAQALTNVNTPGDWAEALRRGQLPAQE